MVITYVMVYVLFWFFSKWQARKYSARWWNGKLFIEAGVIALTAFISLFEADRDRVRSLVSQDEFIEIYCKANLSVCEEPDVKGLYAKARLGQIKDFTRISSPYEVPAKPELELDTGTESLEVCVDKVVAYLKAQGAISI